MMDWQSILSLFFNKVSQLDRYYADNNNTIQIELIDQEQFLSLAFQKKFHWKKK